MEETNKAYLKYAKDNEKDKNDLESYLSEYCREERQFAVYLYNYFEKFKGRADANKDEIIQKYLGIKEDEEITIMDVFFEATLMRDYFEENRKSFNEALLEFCLGWLRKDSYYNKNTKEGEDSKISDLIEKLMKVLEISNKKSSRNLGQGEAKKKIRAVISYDDIVDKIKNAVNKNKEVDEDVIQNAKVIVCCEIASMMMNAVPDILVVYKKNDNIYAKALECKYKSDEGTYKDIAGAQYKMQLFIQECIMHFCFGKSVSTEDIKKHIPDKYPKTWKNKKLWEQIYLNTCNGILCRDREPSDVINAGVAMIKFGKSEGTPEDKWIHMRDNIYIKKY